MSSTNLPSQRLSARVTGITLMVCLMIGGQARVLDDFNDNTRTGWTDFKATDQLPIPDVAEQNQQFFFDIPQTSVGFSPEGLYTASVKTTTEFTLAEGRTVEFRVDLVQGTGDDAFAVLAFVPRGIDPKQTLGYSFAKSANEILLVKALNHYFLDDDTATGTVKHQNVTMVMSLTGKAGNVVLTAKILDKDLGDAVLWERTVTDTPGADFGNEGELGPAQNPFLTAGNFALYMYAIKRSPLEPVYQATFDNAETYVLDTAVLDDFNDNTRTGWTDFKATDQLPIPDVAEQNQQFFFDIPQTSVGFSPEGLYTATVKQTREFAIQDGDRLEFRVDLVQGTGDDAFAVLAFVPRGIDPKQTLGYSFAKSANEILLVKALNHYFLDDDTATGTVKHQNVTMVMSLTGKAGNVILNAKILDKDLGDAVLWDRTVTDTPGADFGNEGELGPAQNPFLTAGNFALYMYAIKRSPLEPVYQATFDNAVVAAAPVEANTAPIITDPAPVTSANFLPVSTVVSFRALDDKSLDDSGLSISLNGTNFTTANGLVISGTGTNKTATLSGQLVANVNYIATFEVRDAEGLVTTTTRHFDTFLTSNRTVEVEDYDYDGGTYLNNPVPVPEGSWSQGTSYSYMTGTPEVDYHDTRTVPEPDSTLYRPYDNVRMQHSLDLARKKYQDAGGAGANVFDYEVGDIAAGEWLNYTRDFTAGSYEVYLREGLLLMDNGRCELQRITAQNTNVLGSFLGRTTGNDYRNFALTDGSGLNKIILRLSGRTTLRLHQITPDPGDGFQYQNYLVFVPVADPGIQRATVSEVSPPNASTLQSAFLTVTARILNRDTAVNTNTVVLQLNGQNVPATVTPTPDGATVSYRVPGVTPAGVIQTAKVTFQDSFGVEVSSEWTFTLSYLQLSGANARAGTGTNAGFFARAVQAWAGAQPPIDSVEVAEQQLALQLPDAPYVDTSVILQVFNLSHDGSSRGYFVAPTYPDTAVPGLDFNGYNDFTVEMKAYVQLNAGAYRIGVKTDDGFKVTSGDSLDNKDAVLALNSGGSDLTFDIVAPVTGLYPFRMIWYNRGGPADGEWFSVDPTTGTRTLINDAAGPVKAYRGVIAPSVVLQSSPSLSPANFQDDISANLNTSTKTITTAQSGGQQFYRLTSGTTLRIKTIQVSGGQVTLTYE